MRFGVVALPLIAVATLAWGQGRQPARLADPPPDHGAFTLDEVISFAEAQSPALRTAGAEIAVARGRALQAGMYPNPEFSTGTPQLAGSDSQYNGMLTQEFVTAGKLRLDQAAVCREVAQARLRYTRARFDLFTALRQQFFSTLAAQQRVEALGHLVDIADKSKVTAGRRQKAGEGSEADTILLDIELDRAQVALENAGAQLAAARQKLAATMGQPDLEIPRLAGDLAAPLPDYGAEAVSRGYLSQNALVQIARVEVERSRLLLRRAEVEPCPNVTFGAGYQYSVGDPNHQQGLIQLSIPVPVWNRNRGGISAARARVGQASQQVEQVHNDLSGQLAESLGRFLSAQQLATRYEQNILPKARKSFELTQRGFNAGEIDFLRLLQAQRALVEANLSYISAQEARWTAAAELAGLLQTEHFP